jgi:hypothetical protein
MENYNLTENMKKITGVAFKALGINPQSLKEADFPEDRQEIIEDAYKSLMNDQNNGSKIRREEIGNYRVILRIATGTANGLSQQAFDRVSEFADKKVEMIEKKAEEERKKQEAEKAKLEKEKDKKNQVSTTLEKICDKLGLPESYKKDMKENGRITPGLSLTYFQKQLNTCLQNQSISYDEYNAYGTFFEQLFDRSKTKSKVEDPQTGLIHEVVDNSNLDDFILKFGEKQGLAEPNNKPQKNQTQTQTAQSPKKANSSKIIKKISESKVGKAVKKFANWVAKTRLGQALTITQEDWDRYDRRYVSNKQLEEMATGARKVPNYMKSASVEELQAMLDRHSLGEKKGSLNPNNLTGEQVYQQIQGGRSR